jgi:hypothetical protein
MKKIIHLLGLAVLLSAGLSSCVPLLYKVVRITATRPTQDYLRDRMSLINDPPAIAITPEQRTQIENLYRTEQADVRKIVNRKSSRQISKKQALDEWYKLLEDNQKKVEATLTVEQRRQYIQKKNN